MLVSLEALKHLVGEKVHKYLPVEISIGNISLFHAFKILRVKAPVCSFCSFGSFLFEYSGVPSMKVGSVDWDNSKLIIFIPLQARVTIEA